MSNNIIKKIESFDKKKYFKKCDCGNDKFHIYHSAGRIMSVCTKCKNQDEE